jgi:hypothetical protein
LASELSLILTGASEAAARRRCLDAFAAQSLPASRYEILRTATRNDALDQARGKIVLFWDAAWRPLPGLLEYCLQFHKAHPGTTETQRVHAAPDVSVRNAPFVRWRVRTAIYLTQPPVDGVYAWPYFRCPGLSCKRSLFESHRFDPAFEALGDLELGARLAAHAGLTVWYEQFPLAHVADCRPVTGVWRDEYLGGYFRRRRLSVAGAPYAAEDLQERFVHPETFDRPDGELMAMAVTVDQLEASLAGVDLSFAAPAEHERLRLLDDLYGTLIACAGARGWMDAAAGRPPATSPVLSSGSAALPAR